MAGFRLTVEGDQRLIRRFIGLGEHYEHQARKALEASVDQVRATAVEGIKNPPKTGRLYTHRFPYVFGQDNPPASFKRRPHRASAKGEWPAADTGNLMRSIHAEVEGLPIVGEAQLELDFGEAMKAGTLFGVITADANYAAPLEYKPPERGGRPFMRRALTENEDFVRRQFQNLERFDPGGIM